MWQRLTTLWQRRHRLSGVWNRLTEQARTALHEAEHIALSRGSSVIEPWHVLYALLSSSQPTVAYLLRRVNLEPDRVREVLEHATPSTAGSVPAVRRMSRDAVQALDTAIALASRWQSPSIGSPHLLLGLTARGTSLAALLEEQFGVTPELLEEEVVRCRMHRLQPPDEQYPTS